MNYDRRHFRLEGHIVVECEMEEWARFFESEERRVALDEIHGITVSTVFLGLDHQFSENGPPLLFETMTFGYRDEICERCTTWAQAEEQHQRICDQLRAEIDEGEEIIPLLTQKED